MKTTLTLIGLLAALAAALLCSSCVQIEPQPAKTLWQSEAVSYSTNSWVWDEERNKTNTSQLFYYTKTVVETNRVPYWPTHGGDGKFELGLREDGVVVWRKAQP